MIPKIIHYSWFSNDSIPDDIQRMMDTWKTHLPDYEFRLWDGKALQETDLSFAHEAASVKKWAFAADHLRIYAVYTYGGIWLDTDVEMFKSFDPFLKHRMFIGHEEAMEFHHGLPHQLIIKLTSHCFGAEAGHPFLKRCLEYYQNRHFITSTDSTLPADMRYDQRILPDIQAVLAQEFGYVGHPYSIYEEEILREGIHVYPAHYFDGPKYHEMRDVVCIHHCLGAWRDTPKAIERTAKKKDILYYLHKGLSSLLKGRGIYIKMYYVGFPKI